MKFSRIFCQVLFTSFLLRTFLNIFIQTCLRLFWHQRISDSSLRSRDIARQTDRQTEYCILVVGWLKLINKEVMTSSVAQVKDCIGTENPTPEAKLRNDHLSFSWASHGIFSEDILKICLHRLSVSESEEWVCTKTVFTNGSTLRECQKTYTGAWPGHQQTSRIPGYHFQS